MTLFPLFREKNLPGVFVNIMVIRDKCVNHVGRVTNSRRLYELQASFKGSFISFAVKISMVTK